MTCLTSVRPKGHLRARCGCVSCSNGAAPFRSLKYLRVWDFMPNIISPRRTYVWAISTDLEVYR